MNDFSICVVWAEIFLAYVILYGDAMIDIDGQRFFQSKKELKELLWTKGFKILKNKVVRIEDT